MATKLDEVLLLYQRPDLLCHLIQLPGSRDQGLRDGPARIAQPAG